MSDLYRTISEQNDKIALLTRKLAAAEKVIEADDAFFLVEDAMEGALQEDVGMDLWLESQERRKERDAARREWEGVK